MNNTTGVSYIYFETCSLTVKTVLLSVAVGQQSFVLGCLNLGADLLSRGGPLVREWRLHPLVEDLLSRERPLVRKWRLQPVVEVKISDHFGRLEVELFGSRQIPTGLCSIP